jgi:hypothetical protein
VDAEREGLERKADAVVAFKEVRDPECDDLAARVRALLARPRGLASTAIRQGLFGTPP